MDRVNTPGLRLPETAYAFSVARTGNQADIASAGHVVRHRIIAMFVIGINSVIQTLTPYLHDHRAQFIVERISSGCVAGNSIFWSVAFRSLISMERHSMETLQKVWNGLLSFLRQSVILLWIIIVGFFRLLWRVARLGPVLVSVAFLVALIFLIMFIVLDTRRDVAYRYAAPGSEECNALAQDATILATPTVDNDERRAAQRLFRDDPKRGHALTCMLQLHAMRPGFISEDRDANAGNPSLGYYLSFLEFEENGKPVQLGADGKLMDRSQIDVLFDHLARQKAAGRQNFVFAFVHGWRHDARVGDENVRNTRLMAAHLASFLEQRCLNNKRYCGATVTAVYIGWRGARVDEQRLDWLFRGYLSSLTSAINSTLASMTLFDRKPVSERIAPSVISALREIDRQIHNDTNAQADWFTAPRLIIVGHSLGGNLLATGLKDIMIGIVDKNLDTIQKPGEGLKPVQPRSLIKSPLGDLVVLLNPASEAEKWFAIQRAFSRRVNSPIDSLDVQNAYSLHQPPIYLSLTAARFWPANAIRRADIVGFEKVPRAAPYKENPCKVIRALNGDYKPSYDYDSATYDLFPLFKFDFRPLAQTIEDRSNPNPFNCDDKGRDWDVPEKPDRIASALSRWIAAFLRNLPMSTDVEQTRTIGHVDPMRPPFGTLNGRESDPATWFGATHELMINAQRKQKPPGEMTAGTDTAFYLDAGYPDRSECAVVDHWLTTARTKYSTVQRRGGARVNWDSGFSGPKGGKVVPGISNQPNLTKIRYRPDDWSSHVEGQIRQTLYFSGMRSITGANDPFWNVRAFESAMTSHNGYVSYPLICSLFQFVMDKVTGDAEISQGR
jgi:hypothetical protein